MPNWKKVIVSGSDALLNSVTASAGFFGTASWASNAIASTSASVINTVSIGTGTWFPLVKASSATGPYTP